MDSMQARATDGNNRGDGRPLPPWVLNLVAAILDSEDTHPKYYQDSATEGFVKLRQCPEGRFLALIPLDVQRSAHRWAH